MYVLIIYLSLGYGQKDIQFQEFTSKQNCEAALSVIKNQVESGVCLSK
jgi:hypothetical protein